MKGRGATRVVEGGEGDDLLVGSQARDIFVMRAGDGHDTVRRFEPGEDRVMFDVDHAYSDIMYMGPLYDGLTFETFTGLAVNVEALDANGDGETDTKISAGDVSITLLGVAPDELTGATLMGG